MGFEEDVAFADSASGFWGRCYNHVFNVGQVIENKSKASKSQYAGIDTVLLLKNGDTVKIDEKVRRKQYTDILLEMYHLYDDGAEVDGWMKKQLEIDWLAYAFLEQGMENAILFKWRPLKKAFKDHGDEWMGNMRKYVTSRNNGYTTYNLPVPISVLAGAVGSANLKVYSKNQKNLPAKKKVNGPRCPPCGGNEYLRGGFVWYDNVSTGSYRTGYICTRCGTRYLFT